MQDLGLKVIELALAERYSREAGEPTFVAVGEWRGWDVATVSKRLRAELKVDFLAAETLQVAIEVSFRGKPSGLLATGAETWVSAVPIGDGRFVCFEFAVEKLRTAVRDLPEHPAGDAGLARVKLLPLWRAERVKHRKFELVVDWASVDELRDRCGSGIRKEVR